MDKKKSDIKEVKIYLDLETKEWLQGLAKEQGKPFRTFLVDSLIQLYETSYLQKELLHLKAESNNVLSKVKDVKTNQ